MKVFIDDKRSPESVLGEEDGKGFIWIKEAWEAKKFLMDVNNEKQITEIHFDHYLGDDRLTGGILFADLVVADILYSGADVWKSLKKMSLHSSDRDIVEEYMEMFEEELREKFSIELINNCQDRF